MFDIEQTACVTPVVVATSGEAQTSTSTAGIYFALPAGGRHYEHMLMNAIAVPNYASGLQERPATRSAAEGPGSRVKRVAEFVEKP